MTETPHNLLQKSTPVYTEPAFKDSVKSYHVETWYKLNEMKKTKSHGDSFGCK